MKRKTVLRSIIASTTLLSLTACGQANLTTTTTAASEPATTTVTATAPERDVNYVDSEPAEYPVFYENSMKTGDAFYALAESENSL